MPAQHIGDVVGRLTTAVAAVINDDCLFVDLRKEHAIKVLEAITTGVGQIHIGDFAAGHLVDMLTVAFDPCPLAQWRFTGDGLHHDVARTFAGRVVANRQTDLLADCVFKQGVHVFLCIDRTAVDGEDIVAFLHTQTRHREWCLHERIPAVAAVDGLDSIVVVIDAEIGTQQADGGCTFSMHVTTTKPVVSDLQFTNHFDQQVIQVFAPLHMFEQRLVAGTNRVPVDAVQIGVVKKLFLHPPGFVKNLLPFLARIDRHAQLGQVDRFGIQLFIGVGNFKLAAQVLQQQLLAVGADAEACHTGLERLGFAVFKAEAGQLAVAGGFILGWLVADAGLAALEIKQRAV